MNFEDCKTKKDRIAYIRDKLGTDTRWALKGLVRIYSFQTEAEKHAKETIEHNGIGFTGCDGNILASYASKVLRGESLSRNQMIKLMNKMPKYAKQLEKVSKPCQNTKVA